MNSNLLLHQAETETGSGSGALAFSTISGTMFTNPFNPAGGTGVGAALLQLQHQQTLLHNDLANPDFLPNMYGVSEFEFNNVSFESLPAISFAVTISI